MKTTKSTQSRPSKPVKKKRTRAKKALLEQKLAMINPNAAGIDIASREHWVCVPEDRPAPHVRQFGTFTCDLYGSLVITVIAKVLINVCLISSS